MNINQTIFEIIGAKLNGEELTDNEKEILANWLSESTENNNIFKKYENMFLYKDDIAFFEGIDENISWEKHLKRVRSSKKLSLRTILKYAAIILPLVIASSILLNGVKWDIFSNNNYCNIIVPKGQIQEIVLADGTKIWLNADSELKYPKEFKGNSRKVYLKGEAYFSVTKNKQKPFIVNSDLMEIKVLGTEFNLSCYENSKNVKATLYEGKIAYVTKDNEGVLEPGFQVILDKASNEVEVKKVNVSQFTSWKDGIYIFDEIRVEDLAVKIARWYNIEVIIKSDSVKEMKFTGAMEKKMPVDFIKELLEETNSVKCELIENVLYIEEIP